jgi:hypothetical protein
MEARANAERLRQEQSDFDEERLFRILVGSCIFLLLILAAILLVKSEVVPAEFLYHLTHQIWMNAATFYREKLDLVLEHASERNMIILQSACTCVALLWLVGLQRRIAFGY